MCVLSKYGNPGICLLLTGWIWLNQTWWMKMYPDSSVCSSSGQLRSPSVTNNTCGTLSSRHHEAFSPSFGKNTNQRKNHITHHCTTVWILLFVCSWPVSEMTVLKVRWLMLLSLQTVAHGDGPGRSYSTTREKQFQGKSGPICSSHTNTHTLSHTLVEQDGSMKTTLCST